MSYDVYFEKDGQTVTFDTRHSLYGGTYQLGGCSKAWLNITYNYSEHLNAALGDGGIRSLYGKTAKECIPILENAVLSLGVKRDTNYWAPTSANAGAALSDLLAMARMCPEGAFLQGD